MRPHFAAGARKRAISLSLKKTIDQGSFSNLGVESVPPSIYPVLNGDHD
jgi:hypothetical protein